MNSWKEAPHLFCNGKFKCNYNHIGKDWVAEIRGIDMNGFILKLEALKSTRTSHFEYCTLIARPISDMSDEEIKNIPTRNKNIRLLEADYKDYRNGVYDNLLQGITSDFLYLLSIGVYPFDQNHNDIIWRYENTNR